MDQETISNHMLSTRNPSNKKGNSYSESPRMENNTSCNRNSKKAGVAILFAGNVNFKPRMVQRDKEGHYIIVRGIDQEKEIKILTCTKFQSTQLYKASIHRNEKSPNTIVTGDINMP